MPQVVDFVNVSTAGLDSSPVAEALAGLRAKLSEGMEIPEELAPHFKFARQKSKLAGVIRGSFFVIKGEPGSPQPSGRVVAVPAPAPGAGRP